MTPLASLRIPSALWTSIRDDVLSTPHLERAAVGFAGIVQNGSSRQLLIRDWAAVPSDEYQVQLAHHLEVSPVFWARAAKRARVTGEGLVVIHSHPQESDRPRFSPSDDGGEDRLVPKIQARASVPVAAIVVSPAGERARCTEPAGRRVETTLQIVGEPTGRRQSAIDSRVHHRQILALGQEGHSLIAGMRVGIVGAGGLGAHVIQQFVHLGVGEIVVVDPDRLDASNLSRLVGASRLDARLHRRKTRVARRIVRRVGASTTVTEVPQSVTYKSGAVPLLSCDVVIGCTDNHWSRTVLNAIAFQYYVPVLDLGVELQAEGAVGGRVTWLAPGSACLWCLGILDPERVRVEQLPRTILQEEQTRGYIQGFDVPAPAVVSINGVVASLAVTEVLARWTGFAGPAPRAALLLYRIADGVVRRASPSPRPGCPTCSSAGLLGAGDLDKLPWRVGRN